MENRDLREFWYNYFSLHRERQNQFSKPGKLVKQEEKESCVCEISGDEYSKVLSLTRDSDRRIFYFFSTVFAIVKRKFSMERIISFDIPNFHTDTQINERIYFTHEIPIKSTFKELLVQITSNFHRILENISCPFEDIYNEVVDKDIRDDNWFLIYNDFYHGKLSIPDNRLRFYLQNDKVNGKLIIEAQYDQSLFEAKLINSILLALHLVTKQTLKNINIDIDSISLGSFADQNKLVNKANSTSRYPKATIHKIFEENVLKNPHNTAVLFKDENITYGELNLRANRLSSYLRQRGVAKEAIIGLLLDPSIDTIVAILGTLKAGCAYLPIDTTTPKKRITEILEDAHANLVLTNKESYRKNEFEVFKQPHLNFDLVIIGEIQGRFETLNHDQDSSDSKDLAYVIYTSGSTGKPKGVMIEHRNVIQLLCNDNLPFSFSENDVWTMFHKYSFDFSVWEMFGALLYGGKLVVIPMEETRDPQLFIQTIKTSGVTVLNQTPTAFYNFINNYESGDYKLSLRYVILGGEALKPYLLKVWHNKYPNVEIINMYGITETTIHATYKKIEKKEIDSNISNIGRPISTLSFNIVDDVGNPVPICFPGELWISGDGVSRGYLNSMKQTEEKFIFNNTDFNKRVYKTGDLVKILENGELVFLGRNDKQVKIRGHRIETAEIEKCIGEIEGIISNIVIQARDEEDGLALCCYFISSLNYTSDQLRKFLAESLNEYMIPKAFYRVDRFPLTHNGKIDVSELSALRPNYGEVLLPRNESEEVLYSIWKDVLKVDNFSIRNTFFELGGDSIKVLKLLYETNKNFQINIDLNTFYRFPTIEKLIRVIDEGFDAKNGYEDEEVNKYVENFRADIIGQDSGASEKLEDCYPMTDIQLGMVYNNLLSDETKSVYSDQMIHYLKVVDFNKEIFAHTLSFLTEENEILRTAFDLYNYNVPLQLVFKQIQVDYDHFELTNHSKEEKLNIVSHQINLNIKKNYDFSKPGLFRVRTFLYDLNRIILLINVHHSIMDGWSYSIFLRKMWKLYHKLILNRKYVPQKLKFKQRDFVCAALKIKKQKNILEYWTKELIHIQDYYSFPFQNPGKHAIYQKYETYKGENYHVKLKSLSDSLKISIKSLLFAGYIYLIYRISNRSKVLTGLTTTTRPVGKDVEQALGCFLNIVPVSYDLNSTMQTSKFLKEVHFKLTEVADHDKLSLFEIEGLLRKKGGVKRSLLNNYFTYNDFSETNEEYEIESIFENELPEDIKSLGHERSHVPFQITATNSVKGLKFAFESSSAKDDDLKGSEVLKMYDTIIDQFFTNLDRPLINNEILDPKQKETIVREFNNTTYDFGPGKTLIGYFIEQVDRIPDKIAVRFENSEISYKDLHQRSNILASILKEYCQPAEYIIGAMLERSIDLIVSVIAILKAGFTYLPIHPDLGQERINHILHKSNCSCLITKSKYSKTDNLKNIPLEEIDWFSVVEDMGEAACTDRLAYIIYTSGTTGEPKGVGISHDALMNRLLWMKEQFNISSEDRILHKTPISFDVSIWELYLWMITGSELCILKDKKEKDPEQIVQEIRLRKISIVHFVPSMLKALIVYLRNSRGNTSLKSLRLVISSGEALEPNTVKDFRLVNQNAILANLYGPTEATIDVTYFCCDSQKNYSYIPIGKPISNIKLFILNQDLQVQPIGVEGELYILGVGVAKGYVNDLPLTKSRFIPCPYLPNGIMYKTGDLCSWSSDGNIRFLGRNDSQIKIRGHRVELEEIVFFAKKHPKINDAVVTVTDESSYDKKLCLYYLSEKRIAKRNLDAFLRNNLSEYMIPTYYLQLERLPMTINGKLNIKSLPKPHKDSQRKATILPIDPIERELANIWSEILNIRINEISVVEHFFDLGGHSLNALQVQIRIINQFNTKVSIEEIITNPTIRRLAQLIYKRLDKKQSLAKIAPAGRKKYYVLSPQQRSLFFIHLLNPESKAYNMPLLFKLLKNDSNFKKISFIINKLIERHSALRISFEIVDGEVFQKINEHKKVTPKTYNYNGDDDIDSAVNKYIEPFNLLKGPLYRIKYINQNGEYYLLFDVHHILVDGTGLSKLLTDFYKMMNNLEVDTPTLEYTDYCEWINSKVGKKEIKKQEKFWLDEFKDFVPSQSLPIDYPENRDLHFVGKQKEFTISPIDYRRIKEILVKNDCTMFMFLISVYTILLYSLSGNKVNVIGSPISARTQNGLQDVVGMLANTVAIKAKLDERKTFREILEAVKFKLLKIYNNQDYFFDALIDKLNIERYYGRNPLFDTCLVFESDNRSGYKSKEFKLISLPSTTSKFDITLLFHERSNRVKATIEYNSGLFKEATINKFTLKFQEIVKKTCLDPDTPIFELDVVNEESF